MLIMSNSRFLVFLLLLVIASPAWAASNRAPDNPSVLQWELSGDRLVVKQESGPLGTYVFRHAEILRPHFQNLHAPDGTLITRRHPPSAPDPVDHPTMHPGLWIAFGDINGHDFWRNKARIEHVRFLESPRIEDGRLRFTAENRLVSADDTAMGTQVSRISVWRDGDSNWVVWDATFRAGSQPLVFGDQEEMGLGVRVTGGLMEKNGPGIIVNSAGARSAKQAWGKVADWCEYFAVVDGRRRGATVFPYPVNPQRAWWHARDYGLLVANPFGPRVLPAQADGKVTVPAGGEHRLQFAVRFFSEPGADAVDTAEVYRRLLAREF